VQATHSKIFVFEPYIRLFAPTYGFVHDFSHMVLDAMVFGLWYWILWHV